MGWSSLPPAPEPRIADVEYEELRFARIPDTQQYRLITPWWPMVRVARAAIFQVPGLITPQPNNVLKFSPVNGLAFYRIVGHEGTNETMITLRLEYAE